MNFLKTKITALTLVVALIGLLGGCDNATINSDKTTKADITINAGDTIYFSYGYETTMMFVDKVDMKNRVIIGRKCNTWNYEYQTKYVISFSDYIKEKAE